MLVVMQTSCLELIGLFYVFRPGITGPATIKFKDEESLLAAQRDPVTYNDEVIWKEKIEINKMYIKNWSLKSDINYILRTLFN